MTNHRLTSQKIAGREFYLTQLYPLQDEVLQLVAGQQTGFYLTGGTA